MDSAAMTPAASAAVQVAIDVGLDVREPVLLHETNNPVLWLQPEVVVAKVASRLDAMRDLRLEWSIAVELASVGAEIAAWYDELVTTGSGAPRDGGGLPARAAATAGWGDRAGRGVRSGIGDTGRGPSGCSPGDRDGLFGGDDRPGPMARRTSWR
jgi:hypothetical protein